MNYKGQLVQMIVCAAGVPPGLIAPQPAALAEKNPDAESKVLHQVKCEVGPAGLGTS
jgi:hypothetical protein